MPGHLAQGGRLTSSVSTLVENARMSVVCSTYNFQTAVFVTVAVGGVRVRNHAKFIVVDHRFLLVTSANFSWSAENRNVEFGVLLDDRSLAEAVQREMAGVESTLYQRVSVAAGHGDRDADGR